MTQAIRARDVTVELGRRRILDGVTFAEAEEKAFKRQFEQAEQRFEVGLTAVTDVHEARATYDNARARAIVARNNLADAKEALFEITGRQFDAYDALQEVLPVGDIHAVELLHLDFRDIALVMNHLDGHPGRRVDAGHQRLYLGSGLL